METEIISLRLGSEKDDDVKMRHWLRLIKKEPKIGKAKIDAFRNLIGRDMKRGEG